MSFLDGDDELLKIDAGAGLVTVVCLTGHSLSESISEFIETCKTTARGEQTFLPRLSGYQIPFSGIASDDIGLMSYADIVDLKRTKKLITWELLAASSEQGQGYIESIDKISQTGEFITFSGVIIGAGAIVEDFFYLATSDTDLFDWGSGNVLVS